ncbi:thermonuclease family protein [Mesorhizobium sp. B1-1-8]|uniref:thermonuclease family protein n=1 Tax=Mesorhizobium sp. B1-1-8 TaxID=2589976 RepID=UPI00112DF0C1|nr:thermonuclease family protein [Mesorhizobium sp. B1-1-8]UCI10729.1 thermonuclease family protein [Mesorhizobium sp. B1-1-8]
MRIAAFAFAGALAASPAIATPQGYFALRSGVTLESGDSWIAKGTRYHLYGVQACLRGTFYTNAAGRRSDCGEASLSVFAAYVADTKPQCAPVAKAGAVTQVVCFVTIGQDRLDLGTLMISTGLAFAALRADGLPLYEPYAVAEQSAREKHAGLWQFGDVQHPAIVLGRAAGAKGVRP